MIPERADVMGKHHASPNHNEQQECSSWLLTLITQNLKSFPLTIPNGTSSCSCSPNSPPSRSFPRASTIFLIRLARRIVMANPNPTSLSVAEVRALAARLQARAHLGVRGRRTVTARRRAFGLCRLVHLTLELQALRSEVRRIAATCGDREAQQGLFDALQGPHGSGVIIVRFND